MSPDSKPLTDLQARVLEYLRANPGAHPPSKIAKALELSAPTGGRGQGGRGKGFRVFNPAQRLIFPLTSLRDRGFIEQTRREDGFSGVAYRLHWGEE